jgi:DNA polymerase (family 10)
LLLRREGYGVDIDEVLRACAQRGVVVEVNANPHRLDLDWRWLRRAVELGCMVSINPDAHSTEELDLTRWGVAIARKGGVAKEHVLNCLDSQAFAAFLLSQRRHSRSPSS